MTKAQYDAVSEALLAANINFSVNKKAADDFEILVQTTAVSAGTLANFATTHGVTIETNRAIIK